MMVFLYIFTIHKLGLLFLATTLHLSCVYQRSTLLQCMMQT